MRDTCVSYLELYLNGEGPVFIGVYRGSTSEAFQISDSNWDCQYPHLDPYLAPMLQYFSPLGQGCRFWEGEELTLKENVGNLDMTLRAFAPELGTRL